MMSASDEKLPAAGDYAIDQLRIVGGKVLVEQEPGSERMSPTSIIIIPDAARGQIAQAARYATGFIRAMGLGMKVGMSRKWKGAREGIYAYRWPMPDVEIGTRVVYRTWAVRADFVRGDKKFDLVSDEVIDVEIIKGETGMASFRPLFDRMLVKRLEAQNKTPGGIIIPDMAKEKPVEGKVLRVGQGRIEENGVIRPLDIVPGDHVLFGKYSGTEVQIDGEQFIILREEDILGIVEKKAAEGAAAE